MAHPVRLASTAAGVILAGTSFGLSHSHASTAACTGGQGSVAASSQAGQSPYSFGTEFGANANGALDASGAPPVIVLKGLNGTASGAGSASGSGAASLAPSATGTGTSGNAGVSTDGSASGGAGSSTSGSSSGDAAATTIGDAAATTIGDAAATTTGDASAITNAAPHQLSATTDSTASVNASATAPGTQVESEGNGSVGLSLAQ